MAFNGSGTFLINTAGQPVVSGTVISSTAFNSLTADLATGLSTAITKDGQTTVTANIPMSTYKFTGLGVGSAATDSANLSQVQSTVTKLLNSVSGADTITATASPTLAAYAAGQMFYFVAAGDNTTSVTLNIDSLGAKAVTRDGSVALAAADVKSGEVVVVVYDGTRFQVVSQLNSAGDARFANVSIASSLYVGGVSTFVGNAGFSANVSIASALSVGGVAAITGATTIGGNLTLSGGTANGVLYLNGSKVATSGSALVFDGTNLGIGTASPAYKLDVNGNAQVGNATAATNRFLYINGVANKAGAVAFQESGVNRWLIGNGAASENGNFEIYDATNGNNFILTRTGNLGLGVTPSAWRSSDKAIQVNTYTALGSNTAGDTQLMNNMYFNSVGTAIYLNTNFASRYEQYQGKHAWYTAASGTAGNAISFTQAMTLDASGNLIVGGTSAPLSAASRGNVTINGASTAIINLTIGGTNKGYIFHDDSAMEVWNADNSDMKFATNNAERARITSGGYFKASNDGAYANSTAAYHELRTSAADYAAITSNSNASPYGAYFWFSAADPNNTTNLFLLCNGWNGSTNATRATIRSNGGLANYQANDVNLSDERVKKDIAPLGSMWDKFKAIEIVTFKYKDQTHDDDNIGVIAQQVESVAPEFVDIDGFGETPEDGVPLKTVYTTDMYHAAIKALQEAMARIETLEAKVTALESK